MDHISSEVVPSSTDTYTKGGQQLLRPNAIEGCLRMKWGQTMFPINEQVGTWHDEGHLRSEKSRTRTYRRLTSSQMVQEHPHDAHLQQAVGQGHLVLAGVHWSVVYVLVLHRAYLHPRDRKKVVVYTVSSFYPIEL